MLSKLDILNRLFHAAFVDHSVEVDMANGDVHLNNPTLDDLPRVPPISHHHPPEPPSLSAHEAAFIDTQNMDGTLTDDGEVNDEDLGELDAALLEDLRRLVLPPVDDSYTKSFPLQAESLGQTQPGPSTAEDQGLSSSTLTRFLFLRRSRGGAYACCTIPSR